MLKLMAVPDLYKRIRDVSTAPRWIIFILDVFICSLSLFLAYLLRFNLNLQMVLDRGVFIPICLITILNIVFFEVFHTYAGIIRLSSSREGIRVVSAVFYSCFLLFITIGVSDFLGLPYIIPTSVLIIYFFTSSFLIFGYRFWVKQFYHRCIAGRFSSENVMVYTKTMSGSMLTKAIESIEGRRYKVVGFIDSNKSLWGKTINNSSIFSPDQFAVISTRKKVTVLFITSDIVVGLKNDVVDYCLANSISLKRIPEFKYWVDGQLPTTVLRNLNIEDILDRPSIKLEYENIKNYLPGKVVLVTGAAGSIGSEIVKQLTGLNVMLLVLCDNRETALHDLQYQLAQSGCSQDNILITVSDIRSVDKMQSVFQTYRPNVVFHAAAYKHVPLMELNPCEAVKNNVLGTKILADLSIVYGVERFVFISTDKAVNPTNVMGASKRIAEMYVGELQLHQQQIRKTLIERLYGVVDINVQKNSVETKFITTRFGNVLGSNGSVIPRFQSQIEKGGPVTVTHKEIVRYFMTIQEACTLVLEAGSIGKGGEVFVFDMGEPVKVYDLAVKMIKLKGLAPEKDIKIEVTGLRPGEKLFEELLCKDEEVIPTHNKKIMISKVKTKAPIELLDDIQALISLSKKNNNIILVRQMKLIVPEFKSQNSTYQTLDAQKQVEYSSPQNS